MFKKVSLFLIWVFIFVFLHVLTTFVRRSVVTVYKFKKHFFLLFCLFINSGLYSQVTIITGSGSWSYSGGAYPPTPTAAPYYGAFASYYVTAAKADGSYDIINRSSFCLWAKNSGNVTAQEGGNTGTIPFSSAPYGIWFLYYRHQYDSSNKLYNQTVLSSVFYPASFSAQVISANNLTGSLAVGQSLNGQATGSQGGNPYVITKTGGGSAGSCNINATSGAYVITASTIGGPLIFQISVPAGNGFAASNVLSGSVTIVDAVVLDPSAPVKKTTLDFTNPLSEPVRVVAVDSVTGVVYAEALVAPGASVVLQINKTSSNAVTLNYNTVNDTKTTAAMSDGSLRDAVIPAQTYWFDSIPDSGFNTSVFQSPTPTIIKPPASAVVSTTPQVPGQAAPASPKITAANTGAIGFTTAPAAPGAAVTDSTTREGLGAVVTELQAINARGDKQVEDDAKTLADAKADASNKAASASSSGASASSQAAGVVPEISARSSYATSGAYRPDFTVTLPASFGGQTFDLDPFRNDRFASICAWFKSAVSWLLVIHFAFWAWGEVKENFVIGILAPQAKGNTVAAGTGGQLTALAAAAAITVALLSFFLAIISKFAGDWSLGNIATNMSSDPLTGMAAPVLWMLERILPVATIISAIVFRVVFKVGCIKLVLGVAAVVRFVIP